MAAAPPLKLNEDEIDELLYLARANEADDLPTYLAEVQKLPQYEGASAADILCAAVDVQSGNSVLHYAAANGHSGTCSLSACLPACCSNLVCLHVGFLV